MYGLRFTLFIYPARYFISMTLCLLQVIAFAQINEDFSNPNLTSNPLWTGNLNHFEINAYHQLHLKSSGTDTSYLSTPLTCSGGMEWKIWVHLSFAPSENNNARIYLISDNANPAMALKAFYIQLGEARSLDAVTLFYKDGNTIREVCRGTAGLIANAFSIRIRVIRSANGVWKIAVDPTGGNLYANEASGLENASLPSGFFSLFCKYTSSNSTGFYFDDIFVQPYTNDTSPPLLLQASVSGDNQIQLNFDEPIEKTISLQLANFSLADGTHPSNVYADPLTGSILKLDFSKPFPIDKPFILTFRGITDLDGNSSLQKEISLVHHVLRSFDVLISEIMSDPTHAKGLPECEYLELYNRSSFPINLKNWSLQTGKSEQLLPDSILASHAYSIITATSNATGMKHFGNVISLQHFSLPNEGCLITLRNKNRQVIHALDFKPGWHDNASKKNGGWSLEMIDPMNPCGESTNYRSSVDARGGTPGTVNSVNADFPDLQFPQLLSVYPTDSMHLRIDFSETLDTLQLSNLSAYFIEPLVGQPKNVLSIGPLYKSALLELANPLIKQIIYKLTVNNILDDCSGNQLKIPFSMQFGLPQALKNKCIVINEIMFDPGPDKEEFIELYNRSAEYYDLSLLKIKVENSTSSTQKTSVPICEKGLLFTPHEFSILTANKNVFMKQYPLVESNKIIEVPGFQALSNEGGTITLSDSSANLIDKAAFNSSMHFQMLRSTSGVSLERINTEGSSESKDNWYSAAETAGFSTPGKVNSQHASQNPSLVTFSLEPDQFTPDNDGKDDNLFIKYSPEKPGSLMTIFIYTINGQLIRKLVSNVMLAAENTFTWDGNTDNHIKAKPGIYLVYAEIYNPSGEVRHIKKTTILSTSLKK